MGAAGTIPTTCIGGIEYKLYFIRLLLHGVRNQASAMRHACCLPTARIPPQLLGSERDGLLLQPQSR